MTRNDYTHPGYLVRRLISIGETGLTVNGTIATTATIALMRFPRAVKIQAISIGNLTGGSAAGPLVTFNKSVAGTGSLVPFGTANLAGTVADQVGSQATITATSFSSADVLVIQKVANTAASAPIVSFLIEYNTDFWDAA